MPRVNRSDYIANSLIRKGFENVNKQKKMEVDNKRDNRKNMFYLILGIMLVLCADGLVMVITNVLGV